MSTQFEAVATGCANVANVANVLIGHQTGWAKVS